MEHPWKLLSAYEFLQQWRCEPLLVPTHYLNRNQPARTEWTKLGEQLVRSKQYKDGEIAAKPGEHYIAVRPGTEEYFVFPQDAGPFCHSWALVRKPRPHVVVIEGLPLPSVNKTSTYNAQYCSLFFRPWTLYRGRATAPRLSPLGMEAVTLQQRQTTRESAPHTLLTRQCARRSQLNELIGHQKARSTSRRG